MNVNTNTSTALASIAGQSAGDAAGVSELRKAMQQAEAQNAQKQPEAPKQEKTAANLPPNLGQNINTTA